GRGKYTFAAILAVLFAQASDDSSSTPNDPNDPCNLCGPEQVCVGGVCYEPTDPCSACKPEQVCHNGTCYDSSDPCAKCTAQQDCINQVCTPKSASDDPCAKCTDNQVCIDKVCKDNTSGEECDPPCTDGKTCIDGQCAICIGSSCFFETDEPTKCEVDGDCPKGERCNEGECKEIQDDDCDPACADGQICSHGNCVSNTLLWTLCRSGSDCGVGECIFNVTPSKTIHLEINGEIVEYTTDNPIPVSLLDSRINPENYNSMHSANAAIDDEIGICSYECTKKEEKICPTGWSCQVVAKGILDYPSDSALLPQDLPEATLKDTPFAALCRRDMDEDLQKDLAYGVEFCNADESKCNAAGMIFYDDMCLEPCEENGDKCPYFFSCQSVETESGAAMACVPDSGTCTGCYDHDRDGAGYGHCPNPGIDCDDNNPNAYYQKPLVCADIVDDQGKEIQTDLNCNGLIDKFELAGTTDNCSICGDACAVPKSPAFASVCKPVDASNYDPDWRKTATMSTPVPEFICIEKCSFGFGDCKGNATCDVALLSTEARSAAAKSDEVWVRAMDVITGKNGGAVYGRDADGDGYPLIDNVASLESATETEPAQILLDPNNSLICCTNNPNYCYTANKDWETIKSTESYVTLKEGCKATDPGCYDADDSDKDINPEADEICDGKDNDGSTILLPPNPELCIDWCANPENDCTSIKTDDGYKVNPYCDAAPDGLVETKLWVDAVENQSYAFGKICNYRNENTDVCDDKARVMCEKTDDDWQLKCMPKISFDTKDGLDANGNPSFNGLDNDCDGRINEDGWVPCVITNDTLPWESTDSSVPSVKDGISNTMDYKFYLNSQGYALPRNEDGSVNLCRLGMLQGKKNGDHYEPICMPIYEPRAYDYYGDGVDSNCDGADYDMNRARFVALPAQGDANAGDDNDEATCQYDESNHVLPCSTINHALEVAVDENGYYQDILVQGGEFNILMGFKNSNHPYPSPITLPNYGNVTEPERFAVPSAAELPDSDGVLNGHFISPYGLHNYLVSKIRESSAFRANDYLFNYETKKENPSTHQLIFNVAEDSEQNRPDEIIRIYGGFFRAQNPECTIPTGCDYWTLKEVSTINWLVTPDDAKVYSMIGPSDTGAIAPLSLRLANLNLVMRGDTDATPSYDLADGVTFIGINGLRSSRMLTLQNTQLSVTGINGYSFDKGNKKKDDEVAKEGTYPSGTTIYSYASVYMSSYTHVTQEQMIDYIQYYNNNSFYVNAAQKNPKDRFCGYGLKSNSQYQSQGGMGGCMYLPLSEQYDPNLILSNVKGKPGQIPGYYDSDDKLVNRTEYNSMVGQPGTAYEEHIIDYIYPTCTTTTKTMWGKPGKGGTAGKNGESKDVQISFAMDSINGLYVTSDRTQARGWYGNPGAGGAGGSLQYNPQMIGVSGGPGGCGGRGGEAGGTGGSALGIVLSSSPNKADDTVLTIKNQSSLDAAVTVTNGNGGKAQIGADGAKGAGARDQVIHFQGNSSFANVSSGSGAGGGGGAGGIGGGGRPGWAYPYVLLCYSDSDIEDFDNAHLSNLNQCKFNIGSDMELHAGSAGYGKQNMTGKGYKDVAEFIVDSDGKLLGKGADGTPVQDDAIRDLCESTIVWDYGGAGGAIDMNMISSLQKDTYTDPAPCQTISGDSYVPIIVKPLIYNTTEEKIKDMSK
ncbi:MAG: putative metal-binding motif-containing protein, partial [Proteobacteria bacterium]|nr:putative metal-binding motif-containing protein [Pseudomonadota bacterium]